MVPAIPPDRFGYVLPGVDPVRGKPVQLGSNFVTAHLPDPDLDPRSPLEQPASRRALAPCFGIDLGEQFIGYGDHNLRHPSEYIPLAIPTSVFRTCHTRKRNWLQGHESSRFCHRDFLVLLHSCG